MLTKEEYSTAIKLSKDNPDNNIWIQQDYKWVNITINCDDEKAEFTFFNEKEIDQMIEALTKIKNNVFG